jgi:hypothetical protein
MRSAGAKVRVNFGQEEFLWKNTFLEESPDEDEEIMDEGGVCQNRS